jgi:predicted CXXCH cytochrome family protein
MKKLFRRFLIGVLFGLPMVVIALVMTQISAGASAPAQQQTQPPCSVCHSDINAVWQDGPHGEALASESFQSEWTAQGKPGACLVCHTTGYDPATGTWQADGVACEACHNPVPANHPADNMPIDKSSDLCGKCHSDPSFSTENWKMSAHYQRSMTCTVCHDPHSAGMKTVVGVRGTNTDASALCINCHKDAMKNFPTSKHAEAGVTCVNCHLGFNPQDTSFEDAHKAPDHDFLPSLDTCNKCHANQMHAPGEAVAAAAIQIELAGGTATPEPTPAVTAIPPVSSEPIPVSPLGFAGLAGLLGLAGGMVLSPWLERAYRHYVKGGKND